MKKTISHKTYNTNTAELLVEYCNERWGSFDFVDECLMKNKHGYFLYGEGGAGSIYSKYNKYDNTYSSGEDIIPITEGQARRWALTFLSFDQVKELFPDETRDCYAGGFSIWD